MMRGRTRQLLHGVALSATVLASASPVGIPAAIAAADNPSTTSGSRWKHFPPPPMAPSGAPNVLLIMTDDVGFGAASTFGGPIPTPTFDALARAGLRYTSFHVTARCSPTRAALMTGRNHH